MHKSISTDSIVGTDSNKISDVNSLTETKFVKIYISGNYGWNLNFYEYELKTTENEYWLTLTIDKKLCYKKILFDNEYLEIYNFINEHEMEQNIKDNISAWTESHDFRGLINININNKIYENKIYSSQDFENNMYKILNLFDSFIEEDNYKMPIIGVGKYIR